MLDCFFFFTRCVFSDIIRLNNLIFQVICRFRHLNSNIISFAMIFFTLNFTKISDDIFGIQMSIFFRSEKKNGQAYCHSFPEYIQYGGSCRCHTVYANSIAGFPEQGWITVQVERHLWVGWLGKDFGMQLIALPFQTAVSVKN